MCKNNTKESEVTPLWKEERQLWLWDRRNESGNKIQTKNPKIENQRDEDWIFGKQKPKI